MRLKYKKGISQIFEKIKVNRDEILFDFYDYYYWIINATGDDQSELEKLRTEELKKLKNNLEKLLETFEIDEMNFILATGRSSGLYYSFVNAMIKLSEKLSLELQWGDSNGS